MASASVGEGIVLREERGSLSKLVEIFPVRHGFPPTVAQPRCVTAWRHFVVLGMHLPLVVVYDSRTGEAEKVSLETGLKALGSKKDGVSSVKLSGTQQRLAVGRQSGALHVLQMLGTPEERRRHDRTKLTIHNCEVSCVEWDTRGSLLLSGDVGGKVMATYLDMKAGKHTSWAVFSALAGIVQLSYAAMHLLVSNHEDSVICHIHQNLRDKAACRVGTKDRKRGPFGGCCAADQKSTSTSWLVARPGLRVWKVQSDGQVETTILFKDQVQTGNCPSIVLLGIGTATSSPTALGEEGGIQFGQLLPLRSRFVLSWCEDYLWLLEPEVGVVAGLAKGHGKILDVCVDDRTVYVLREPVHGKEPPIVRLELDPVAAVSAGSARLLSLSATCLKQDEEIVSGQSSGTASETVGHGEEVSTRHEGAVASGAACHEEKKHQLVSNKASQLMAVSQPLANEPSDMEACSGDATEFQKKGSLLTASDETDSGVTQPSVEGSSSEPLHTGGKDQVPVAYPIAPASPRVAPVAPEVTTGGGRLVDRLLGVVSSLAPSSSASGRLSPSVDRQKSSSRENLRTASESLGTSRELVSQWLDSAAPSMEQDDDSLVVVHGDGHKKKKQKKKKKKGTDDGTETGEGASPKPMKCEPGTDHDNEMGGGASSKSVECEPDLLVVEEPFTLMVERSVTPTPMLEDVSGAEGRSSANTAFVPIHHNEEQSAAPSSEQHSLSPSHKVASSTSAGQESNTSQFSLTTDGKGPSPLSSPAVLHKSSLCEVTPEETATCAADSGAAVVNDNERNHPVVGAEDEDKNTLLDISEGAVEKSSNPSAHQESLSQLDSAAAVATDQTIKDSVAESRVAVDESHFDDEGRESGQSVKDQLASPTISGQSVALSHAADNYEVLPAPSRHHLDEIVCSSRHIWVVDTFDYIYSWSFSKHAWTYVKGNVQTLTTSLTGNILWGVSKSGTVKYRNGIALRNTAGVEWMKMPTKAKCAAADDGCCWILTKDGELQRREGVTASCPSGSGWISQPEPEVRYDINQLAAGRGVLWARTTSSRLFARVGIDTDHPLGTGWQEVSNISACHVDIGPRDVVWCVNDDGVACFMRGVKRNHPCGDGRWWQVSIGQQVQGKDSSLLSSIMDVSMSINALWSKGSTRRTDSLKFVAASEAGVCAVSSNSYVHLSSGPLVGSYYCHSSSIGLSLSVSTISAGASTEDGGVIWLARPNGEIFGIECGHRPVSLSPPEFKKGGHLVQMAASSLHVAVWVLDSDGIVYERSGLSQYCQLGTGWKMVDVHGVRGGKVQSISCGGYTGFVTDSRGDAWFRYTCEFGPQGREEWYQISRPSGEKLVQVAVGPGDWNVWAIDSNGGLHVRMGISIELPGGAKWKAIEGVTATALSVSAEAVWARCPNGDIVWRCGVTPRNPVGDYWKRVPGSFAQISVSPTNELWVINDDGELYVRKTHIYQSQERSLMSQESVEEAGWELV